MTFEPIAGNLAAIRARIAAAAAGAGRTAGAVTLVAVSKTHPAEAVEAALAAVALFDVIETVDRPRLAEALAAEMARSGRRPDCFVQVNTGEEAQKAGVAPGEAAAFVARCRDELRLPVRGLMCIPPVDEAPAIHFAFLRELAQRVGLGLLSMGMSHDFESAVALGATHVRVGTAIFGARPPIGPGSVGSGAAGVIA